MRSAVFCLRDTTRAHDEIKGRILEVERARFNDDELGLVGYTQLGGATLAADGAFIDGRVISARQKRPNGPRLDDSTWLVETLRKLSKRDFGEGAPTFADDGAIAPP